jgi:hypothetical protein
VAGAGLVALVLPSAAQAAPAQSASEAVTTFEKGHVLACSGKAGKRSVTVELYDNSVHGSFVSVAVEGPDGQFGGSSTPAKLFNKGSVRAKLPIKRLDEQEIPAGTASIQGIYAPTDEPRPVHDTYEDAGWIVESIGTNQSLKSKVRVNLLSKSVRLTCNEAFAYDLKVTKIPV